MPLGSRVRELRKQLDLTQSDLARAVDVDPSYISQIETGRIKQPSLDVIRALARALHTTPDDLLAAMLGGKAEPELDLEDPELELFFYDLKELSPEQRDFLKKLLRPHFLEWRRERDRERRRREREHNDPETKP